MQKKKNIPQNDILRLLLLLYYLKVIIEGRVTNDDTGYQSWIFKTNLRIASAKRTKCA